MTDPADRLYERVLVLRCQAGDEGAFAELVARYSPRLGYYLRKMLGEHAAQDALQEVWIDVLGNIGKLASVSAFPAWVYRIARDRVARRLRGRRLELCSLGETAFAVADAADEFTADDAARIHAALDKLPADQREILVLRFLEEMTYDDLARVLLCPVGTVRSRLHYAKRSLRRLLKKDD